jgi:regulator of sigma E protease
MEILVGIIIGIIVLTVLVVAHELGHALVAKRYGVVVEEFGVGFPPKAWSKKVKKSFLGKNVRYSINWLPLGGFVKLQGEHDAAATRGDYGAATFWQKTQILLAGVVMNWIVAAVILTALALVGMPRVLDNQFYVAADVQRVAQPVELVAVADGLPAAKAGLKVGDRILRFAGSAVADPTALSQLAKQYNGKTVEVIYSRQDVEGTTKVALRDANTDGKGYLGVSPSQQEKLRSTWSAPIVGVGTTLQMSWVTLQGLGDVLWNGLSGLVMKLVPAQSVQTQANERLANVSDSVAGPVGIFGVIFPAAEKAGPLHVMMLAAIISLTLAVMNILPIPALDGGRWFVTALFKLMKKPLGKDLEERIHGIGFAVLMVLVVLVTIADIGKL